MAQLSEHDWAYARTLRDYEVLQELDLARIDLSNGIIWVGCADCDQFEDRYDFWKGKIADAGGRFRPHPLMGHGGALRLPEDSPINLPGRSTAIDLIDEIIEAAPLKGISTLVLEAHGPCGKAVGCGLDLESATEHFVAAIKRVESLRQPIQCLPVFHLDWPNATALKKRYYRFSVTNFCNMPAELETLARNGTRGTINDRASA